MASSAHRGEQQELELELEYFERVPLTPRLVLLRVAGTWTGLSHEEVTRPALVVDDGLRARRFSPLAAPEVEGERLWRAAFAVTRGLTELSETTYVLDVGSLVALPPPGERALAPERARAGELAPAPPAPNGTARHSGEQAEPPAEEGLLVAEAPAAEPPAPADDTPPPDGQANGTTPFRGSPGRPSPPPVSDEEAAALETLAPRTPAPWWKPALFAAGAVIIVVGAGFLAVELGSSTDDRNGSPAPASPPRAAAPPRPAAAPRAAALAALPGVAPGAHGTLRPIGNGRLELDTSGLPAGTYELWLYRDVIDAKPLGHLRGPRGALRFVLPADAGDYSDLDLSREGDRNPAHSGRSVLRVPLDEVRRAGAAAPGR